MIRKYDKKAATLAAIRYLLNKRINYQEEVVRRICNDFTTRLSHKDIYNLVEKYQHTTQYETIKNAYIQQLEISLYKIRENNRFVEYILNDNHHKRLYWFFDGLHNLYCTDDYDIFQYFYGNTNDYIVLIIMDGK